jgi:hypothetical protein
MRPSRTVPVKSMHAYAKGTSKRSLKDVSRDAPAKGGHGIMQVSLCAPGSREEHNPWVRHIVADCAGFYCHPESGAGRQVIRKRRCIATRGDGSRASPRSSTVPRSKTRFSTARPCIGAGFSEVPNRAVWWHVLAYGCHY